jgi:predicted metal-binding membrane protein
VTLQRQTLAVATLLGAALGSWIVLIRGMGMMDGLAPFLGVWVTMMAAMMLPSVAPMVATHAAIGGRAAATGSFVLGYFAVWTAFGLAAYGIAAELPRSSWLAAAALVVAGLYQLTPLKEACLRRCRAPLGFLAQRWRPGHVGAARLGIEHGAWCTGCCGGLMVALFALGLMSLAWMAAVALVILAEKVLPGGETVARASGLGLVVAGGALLA